MSNTDKVAPAQAIVSVNDSGRVRIGAGMIRYASPSNAKPAPTTTDSGRVKVGAGMMRYASPAAAKPAAITRDLGKVKVGAGMMRFAPPTRTKDQIDASRLEAEQTKADV